MRRPVLALAVAGGLLAAAGGANALVPAPVVVPSSPVTAPFVSDNVTHVGTVPVEGAGVSMEVREVAGQVRAYVSGAAGLSIYDATDPTAPELLGHLPVYNWENEDIAVSGDGRYAYLTEFTAGGYLHKVDVSNPLLPTITGTLTRRGPHTVVCATDACEYLYGSDGRTYDVRGATPVALPDAERWSTKVGATGSIHNLHRDEAGVWVSDTTPLVVFEQVDGNPLELRRIAKGGPNEAGYQHNNVRPNADQYRPRPETAAAAADIAKAKVAAAGDDALRPGELLLGNGETNFTGQCEEGSNGAFSTWSMKDFDKGEPLQQLHVLEPLSGDYTDGDPALNVLGCSGHWFTEKDAEDGSILVAGAWYEHGTRFLKVDPTDGAIEQVGFFQPVRGAASEAFWMPGERDVVWTIDYHSGIDILVFDQDAEEPTAGETDASWLAKAGVVDPFAAAVRDLCKAGADLSLTEGAGLEGHVAQHHAVEQVAVAAGEPSFAALAARR